MSSNGSVRRAYTLYHNYYSICSIQIRYLISIKGEPKERDSEIILHETPIDIFNEEQLSEEYLTQINPHGQVPVLGNPTAFSFPLAQTAAISAYVAERYPSLRPKKHAAEISKLVEEMHELNFFPLSFRGGPEVAVGIADGVQKRLNDNSISDEYRRALEYKIMIVRRDKISALEPERVQAEVDKAKACLDHVSTLLEPESGPWLFGQKQPTELDAHLVVLIARLQDVGRHELICEPLKEYAAAAYATTEWKETMAGRRTMYPGPGKK